MAAKNGFIAKSKELKLSAAISKTTSDVIIQSTKCDIGAKLVSYTL
jgi:hypothetical protein